MRWCLRRRLAPALLLLSSFVSNASAIELPDELRAAIEQGVANGRYQSVAVALIDRESQGEWFFGAVSPDGAKPTASDAFEIGSTTRSFTGLLLAQALVAGKLHLEDRLDKIFGDIRFTDPRLAQATILSIATHRAGLPAVPPNLFPRNVDDPYVEYDAASLLSFLSRARLDAADVGRYRYSELGVALLGEAIARAYRKDYRSLVASEVLVPLALTQTGFGNVPNLLDGFHDGQPVAHWQQQTLAAAAGLRSTLGDLERFATVQLRPDASPLRAAVLLAREPRAIAGGGETALAWQIVPVESEGQTWPLLWQAGMTGGFSSFIGLRTDQQRAIVIVGNAGIDVSTLGLTLLADRHAPNPPPKLHSVVAPASLAYEGWYRVDGGGDLIVRNTPDGLSAQLRGLLPQKMLAYDDDAFELDGEDSQLTFQRDGTKISGATLHRNGMHQRADRLSEGAPSMKRKLAPADAKDIALYAGDYALSPSVRAHVVAAPPGLRVQLTGTAPVFVQSCAVDRFCDADGTLEVGFARDASKRVVGIGWRQGVFEAKGARDDW